MEVQFKPKKDGTVELVIQGQGKMKCPSMDEAYRILQVMNPQRFTYKG